MNSLSILIYLIGVIESLNNIFPVIGMGCILAIIMICFGHLVEGLRIKPPYSGIIKKLVITLCVICALNVVIPDKKYVILIAASEVGEKMIDSENGKKLTGLSGDTIDLLRVYIKQQTDQIRNEVSKEITGEPK